MHISSYWPNAGLSLIAVLLATRPHRARVLLALLAATWAGQLLGGQSTGLAAGIALACLAETWVTTALLTRVVERPRLTSTEEFVRLAFAATVGAVAAGLSVALTLQLLGQAEPLLSGRRVAASHLSAVLLLAPLALTFELRDRSPAKLPEQVSQWAVAILTSYLIFRGQQRLPIAFAVYPVLVWGGLRLTARQMAWQVATIAALAAALSGQGRGLFQESVARLGADPQLVGTMVQLWSVVAILIGLPLALVSRQQRAALTSLLDSHDEVASILSAATSTAILGVAIGGRITFFNSGAAALSGYAPDEVIDLASVELSHEPATGIRHLTLVFGDDTSMVPGEILDAGQIDSAQLAGDYDFVDRSGRGRVLAVQLTLRLDRHGDPVGFLGVADDVTERRRQARSVEDALIAEKQVTERLAEIDRTKNEFLSTVSHELRTPITSILGYSQLLINDTGETLPTKQRQIIERVERNARRLLGLIQDMLTMSQIGIGAFTLDPVELDLHEPLRAALESLAGMTAAYQVTLIADITETPLPLKGDADQLERVLINLLGNAVKFSHPGGTVRLHVDREGDLALLSVADDGVGISQADQAHLFTRFFRAATAHEHAIQGAGLGLAIAQTIVADHGGTIDVESTEGAGSTFTVTLPLGD